MRVCEVCGKEGEIHHIVHRCEGGVDLHLNYKYLCEKHHRGKNSPHGNVELDIKYKIELQSKLENLLFKEYYTMKEVLLHLEVSKGKAKRIFKGVPLYKQGYKSKEIIHRLMGNKGYKIDFLGMEQFMEFFQSEA